MAHGLDGIGPDGVSGPVASRQGDDAAAERLLGPVNHLITRLSAVALVLAAIVLSYSVVTRYFLHWSTDWQDEMSVFLIVGAVFMSSAAVQARRGHVAIEAFASLLSPGANMWRLLLVDVATLIFCGYFSWKSGLLLHEAWVDGYRSSSTWQPPLWIPYGLMTVGMALLTIQVALQVIVRLRFRSHSA